jgi:hypothetical protein
MERKTLRYVNVNVYFIAPNPQGEVVPSMFSSGILRFSYKPINKIINIYRPFTTTVSQLKICDFSGETFKGF